MNKRIAVSVGLVAVGASAVHAVASDAPKPWTASVGLRAVYDDNYTLANNNKQSSWGFAVDPAVSLNLPMDRTLVVGRYQYSYHWYADRDDRGLNTSDQSHQFTVDVTQTVSERLTGYVGDDFVVAQEPRLLDPNAQSYPGRANGNNIRNTGYIGLNAILTQLLTGSLNYNNTIVDYEEKGGSVAFPSRSGLLDRVAQSISAQVGWQVSPTMTAYLGYNFDTTCYTGDEQIAVNPLTSQIYSSSVRNSYGHRGTVGVGYSASEVLRAMATVGIQYTDFYNDPASTSTTSPYADVSVSYLLTQGSTASLGFTHSRNATDVVMPNTANGRVTHDQESSTLHGQVVYQVTPLITATLVGSAQASTFNDGVYNDKTDWLYFLEANLSYTFMEHLKATVGYQYDKVNSDIPGRGYDRNRFTIGLNATY